MQKALEPVDRPNLSTMVYTRLCDALTQGQFRPGDRLKIRELAEQLGTSVTPVRDAVLRLAHDDAIVFHTVRDIRIPYMSEARYREIRSIRIKLEGFAAEVAAQVATKADIGELERLLAENEAALESGDRLTGTRLNESFHFALPRIANLPVLHGILRGLWLQMGPLISDNYLRGGRTVVDYHYVIIDALKRHNSSDAAMAIADDIVLGGKAIADYLENSGKAGGGDRPGK